MNFNHFKQAREDFPMLRQRVSGRPLVYFDSAATAHKPQQVIDAVRDCYAQQYATAHRALYTHSVELTERYEQVRRKVQQLLNAKKSEEIIFTRGTTESINIVALSYGNAFVGPGDEIIISEMEHHSNIVPWQMLCERKGAKLKVIPMNSSGELCLKTYREMLNPKVKIVAVAHVSNAIGTVHPIKQLIDMAHQYGAKVLIDGAQSVPHMPVNVLELDADFYAFSGHKAYGPTGIGILYGKHELLERMPPHYGGGDMIETVSFEQTTYNQLPLKFEAGTPLIAGVIGLGAAIDYLNSLELDSINKFEKELLKYATNKLAAIKDIRILGSPKERGAILSFVVEGAHALDIGTLLNLKGIAIRTGHLCAQPVLRHYGLPSICRASFAFYNTVEEVNFFTESLQDAVEKLK